MAWDYSKTVKKLFLDAMYNRPDSYLGSMEQPDAKGIHGSIACGDAIIFYIKTEKNPEDPTKDKIVKARYKTFGCTSAIASSEALCFLVESQNLSPIDALSITSEQIVDFLGGMPEQKLHCSVMGAEVLRATVIDWAKRRGIDLKAHGVDVSEELEDDGELICECFALTDNHLKREIKNSEIEDLDELAELTKAGSGCGTCVNKPGGLFDLLNEMCDGDREVKIPEAKALPQDLRSKAELLINSMLKTQIKQAGGELSLVEIKNFNVYCDITDPSDRDQHEQFTVKEIVESVLKETIHRDLNVIDI